MLDRHNQKGIKNELESYKNPKFIRIGDILNIEGNRYKVTGGQFHLSQYKLDETKQMIVDSAYSETPASPVIVIVLLALTS